MDFDYDIITQMALDILITGIVLVVILGPLALVHFFLTLPMRRAERARLFLDLIERTLKQGQPIEETLISLAQSRDLSMGPYFHLVAAWMETNLPLDEALAKTPQFLPPQVTAMLLAGRQIDDVRKVLPACRQLLKDAVSHTRGALNYLVVLTFVITPIGWGVAALLRTEVVPKLKEVFISTSGENIRLPRFIELIFGHLDMMILLQAIVLLALWVAAFIYMGGPRVARVFPILQRIHYWMPWRRKRMKRDFSAMLAILLDSGVPEPEAVALAADCTANKIFRKRAARVIDGLKRGLKLTEAIQAMDDSGEFGWRLANAFHGGGGFLKALAGWHESLDAKAFQQEQAAAHGITTALVLWSGLFVAAIVISVFMLLISLINGAILW